MRWPRGVTSAPLPGPRWLFAAVGASVVVWSGCRSFRCLFGPLPAILQQGNLADPAELCRKSPPTRTTQLYDRREDRLTLDEVVKQYSRVGRRPTLRSTRQKYPEKPTQSLQRGSRQLCQ
jgi:hypothetical protein